MMIQQNAKIIMITNNGGFYLEVNGYKEYISNIKINKIHYNDHLRKLIIVTNKDIRLHEILKG